MWSWALIAVLSGACAAPFQPGTAPSGARDEQRVKAVASFTVLADLVAQVGGKQVAVSALVPSGADPNTFQPAPRHVVTVAHADIVFLNGLGIDRTARAVVSNAARPSLPIVVLSDRLTTVESRFSNLETAAGEPPAMRANPYLWLDPRNAVAYVERIRDALSSVDPGNSEQYRRNAQQYTDRIQSLDAQMELELAAIPSRNRKLVTLHEGFPYFARRYGFEVVGVVMKTPGREPTAQEIVDVARVMRGQEVPAVFTEPQINARVLKLAARDAGIRIATLYSDTLDATVPTYEALLRYNARQLVNGLR